MRFQLKTSGFFYPDDKKREKLEKLGFKFEHSEYKEWNKSDDGEPTIEIDSLEKLLAFIDEWGMVVVKNDSIEIYDDHRE